MARKLSDVLKQVKQRARKAGPEHLAAFEALDAHFSQVAKDLASLRARKGLTQRELAQRTGLPQSEISRTLSGRTTRPRIDTLQRLAAGMDAELRVVPKKAPVAKAAPKARRTAR